MNLGPPPVSLTPQTARDLGEQHGEALRPPLPRGDFGSETMYGVYYAAYRDALRLDVAASASGKVGPPPRCSGALPVELKKDWWVVDHEAL